MRQPTQAKCQRNGKTNPGAASWYSRPQRSGLLSFIHPNASTHGPPTTDKTFYNKLDVDHTVDRQGRVTYNTYDAIRELLSTTDPLGRTTKYTWCLCGGLSTLTDANGNVTTWGLDTQGRVTSKTY